MREAIYHEGSAVDIGALFNVLWKNKVIIVSATIIVGILSFVLAFFMPNVYKAEALLAPANNVGQNGFGALASQYGGLASLAGISLSSEGTDKVALGIEVLKSRKFFADFNRKHNVLVELLAIKGWDEEGDELLIDDRVYDYKTNSWVFDENSKRVQPSILVAHQVFLDRLNISKDKNNGLVKMSIDHYSPVVAKKWLDWLIVDLNETVKQSDIARAKNSIDYLKGEVESTSYTELQAGLFELIQAQIETITLANASPEYLFQVIDPPVVSESPYKPRRKVIVLLGLMLGLMGGVVLSILRNIKFQK